MKVADKQPRWLSKTRLVDEVAEEIRQRIYTGHYPLGARLRQVELATDLDVSRTPLKEALRMLEVEGLVIDVPSGGVQVVSPTVDLLFHAYEFREAIDGLAARLAAQSNGDGVDFDALLATQADCLQREWDGATWTSANVAFHGALMHASSNPYLVGQMSIVRLTAQVFVPVAHVGASRAEGAFREHSAIAEAVRRGEAKKAERLARAHVRTTINDIASAEGMRDLEPATSK